MNPTKVFIIMSLGIIAMLINLIGFIWWIMQ